MPAELGPLLDLLACPECRETGLLTDRELAPEPGAPWSRWLAEEAGGADRALGCPSCGRQYPVTTDGIPLMWSDALRDSLARLGDRPNGEAPGEQDVKAANITVYERTVAQYERAGIHADDRTSGRIRDALRIAGGAPEGWHLDVGCGAGNVLRAVPGDPALKVGMDISLSALRLVRRQGFHAVLGDAERLPFRQHSLALVTASSVLHHLYDPTRLMAEAYRALGPTGLFFTDFDPNKVAAAFGPLARALYRARLPLYRLIARWSPSRFGHGDQDLQTWNSIAEFHNRPGAGFAPEDLAKNLETSGFQLVVLYRHNGKDAAITPGAFAKSSPRHLVAQTLSGRNPFLRANSDTLLTLSVKPGA